VEARVGDARRTFVVVNPASGAGATGRRWDRIARALRRELGAFEHAITDGPRHATALTRRALDDGFTRIVAVGGDGTLSEVANGFFDGRRPRAPDAVLGLIPRGTGTDLARTLGIEPALDTACAHLARATTRVIDVGYTRFLDHHGSPAERVVLNATSFGCGGAVAAAVGTRSKRLGGRLAFLLATARTLLRYRDQSVSLRIDDGALERLTITCCVVCNGRFFGGGMHVAPEASLDDGRLDVTVWQGFRFHDFIVKRGALYNGTHVHDPGTRTLRAVRVYATSDERVLLEIDGEAAGTLPATFEIIPAALRVVA
jgi:YegS/Rv2252/BmrU family lipid kinase